MKKLFMFILFFGFLSLANHTSAQPANPPAPVPLDGGLSLLIGAGALYGAKKYKDSRQPRNS